MTSEKYQPLKQPKLPEAVQDAHPWPDVEQAAARPASKRSFFTRLGMLLGLHPRTRV
jgi:hypothetical protein